MAARACGLVGLEPTRVSVMTIKFESTFKFRLMRLQQTTNITFQVAEILKDQPSWFRDCRAVDVLNVLPTANGGTIELLYMQVTAYF